MKTAKLWISEELFREILKLPADTRVHASSVLPSGLIEVTIEQASLPEVADGDEIPVTSARYRSEQVAIFEGFGGLQR